MVEQLSSYINFENKDINFKIVSYNINGLYHLNGTILWSKWNHLQIYADTYSPDVIAVQEINCQYNKRMIIPALKGYINKLNKKVLFYDEEAKVVFYIRSKYAKQITLITIPKSQYTEYNHQIHKRENGYWIKWIKLALFQNNQPLNLIISDYYRSPNRDTKYSDIININIDLNYIYKNVPEIHGIIMMGDYNIKHPQYAAKFPINNLVMDHINIKEMDKMMEEYSLQVINIDGIPTHIKGNVLDYLMVSYKLISKIKFYKIINMHESDHHAIYAEIKINKLNTEIIQDEKYDKYISKKINYNYYKPKNIIQYVKKMKIQWKDVN